MKEITFEKRHEGLGGAVNGGYLTGYPSEAAHTDRVTVRIERPVPIGERVSLFSEPGWAAIRHCDVTLAETFGAANQVDETEFVPTDEALEARRPDLALEMFADCFVCGRGAPTGLGEEPRQLADGRFVAIWHPAAGEPALTGSMTNRIDFLPQSDQRLMVVGEAGPRDGRKLQAITTIHREQRGRRHFGGDLGDPPGARSGASGVDELAI